MKKKSYRAKMALGEVEGTVVAEFATLGVIDYDGDVTLEGAFRQGQAVVIEPWNHNYGELPVGAGSIRTEGGKAILEGEFFIDMQSGADHYEVVRKLAERGMGEWSYTFDVLESETGEQDGTPVNFLKSLDVWGVGPVTRGAGMGTRTMHLKGKGEGGDDEAEADGGKASDDDQEPPSGPRALHRQVAMLEISILELEIDAGE